MTGKTFLQLGVEQRPVSMFLLTEFLYAKVSIFFSGFPGNCTVTEKIFTGFVSIVKGYKL